MMDTALNAQQEAFCQHYAQHLNGAAAYAAAYPQSAVKGSDKRSECARRLLRRRHVLARIAELRGDDLQTWLSKADPDFQPSLPANPTDIEFLALVAFDERRADIARLAALRRLDAKLRTLTRSPTTGLTITVTVSLTPAGPRV